MCTPQQKRSFLLYAANTICRHILSEIHYILWFFLNSTDVRGHDCGIMQKVCSAHHASLLVALHVTKRPYGANASNRVCVRAGKRGTNDSNEALSKAVSVRSSFGSSSTPGYVGKANTKRAGRPESGEAVAQTELSCGTFSFCDLRRVVYRWLVAVMLASVMVDPCTEGNYMQIRIIRISAAAEVASSAHHASLLVALHVTKRQDGANASNRVCV